MSDAATLSYPLLWPEGWPRTKSPKPGPFKVSLARARDDLVDELRLMGAQLRAISTNIPTRRDGLPYAGWEGRRIDDHGVAAYFVRKDNELVIACDSYRRVEDNLRAVGLTVASLRAIERYGSSQALDRAFLGLAALPSPDHLDWRTELGFPPQGKYTRHEIDAAYRARAKLAHPDHGGSDAAMARLSRAREAALKEIGGQQ